MLLSAIADTAATADPASSEEGGETGDVVMPRALAHPVRLGTMRRLAQVATDESTSAQRSASLSAVEAMVDHRSVPSAANRRMVRYTASRVSVEPLALRRALAFFAEIPSCASSGRSSMRARIGFRHGSARTSGTSDTSVCSVSLLRQCRRARSRQARLQSFTGREP